MPRIIQQAPDGTLQPSSYLGNTSVSRRFYADLSHDPFTHGATLAIGDTWQQSSAPVSTGRPSGPGYVTYESLYVSGDTLQQTLNRATGLNTVTFPEGLFQFSDFANGFRDGIRIGSGGATNCGGIAGSGRNTIFQMVPGSSTHQTEGNVTTGTINLYLLNIAGTSGVRRTKAEFRNFQLLGSEQGHYYNGIQIGYCNGAIVDGLYCLGTAPGFANFPPGETFQIAFYNSNNGVLQNSELDGRSWDGSGTKITGGQFTFGTNSGNGHANNVYAHHSRCSGAVWYSVVGGGSSYLRTEFNGSGSGSQLAHAINHERVTGNIVHDHTTFIIDRAHGNSGLHMSMQNDQANDPDFHVIEPTFDAGPGASGCWSLAIDDAYPYTIPPNQMQTSMPEVIKNGRTLIALDSGSAGGANAAVNFIRYH